MEESLTRSLAILGAVTGSIGTLTGFFALLWQMHIQRRANRVELMIKTNQDLSSESVEVVVSNSGKIPTTLQAVIVEVYSSKWWRRKPLYEWQRLRNVKMELPHFLEEGKYWSARLTTKSLNDSLAHWPDGILYIFVHHSRSTSPVKYKLPTPLIKSS